MSDEETRILHKMIMSHLENSTKNQGAIFKKLDEQGATLGRLTTTVEIHQKYSENLEKEQKLQRKDINTIKEEVDEIKDHVKEVRIWVKILKPTRAKVLIVAAILSTLGGKEALKTGFVKDILRSYLNEQIEVSAPARKRSIGPTLDVEPAALRKSHTKPQ